MNKRVFYKNPSTLKEGDVDYCKNCGHFMDYRIYNKKQIARSIFEGICNFCQKRIDDPDPERTERIGGV